MCVCVYYNSVCVLALVSASARLRLPFLAEKPRKMLKDFAFSTFLPAAFVISLVIKISKMISESADSVRLIESQ